MATQETDGTNLRLTYDPALEKKMKDLFRMTLPDIIATISGITTDKSPKGAAALNIHASNWYLNLFPTGDKLDVLIGDKRYAVYSPTQEQKDAYRRLTKAGVPVLEEVVCFRTQASANPFVIARVPVEARLLSQLPLVDSAPTDKTDLGSLEILNESGKLLAQIQSATGKLPGIEGLKSFVFTPFKKDGFLQLTPPFSLEDGVTIEQIGEQIKRDLSIQHPDQNNAKQLKAFHSGFKQNINV